MADLFAPLQFPPFARDGFINRPLRNAQGLDQRRVQEADAPAGNGAHGQFLVRRHAQFSDQKRGQGRLQSPGHLERHRNAAARQTQNNNIRAAGISSQFVSQ